MDNGTHSVDLLRYLFGPVRWVDAVEGPRLQDLAVEDCVRLRLGFQDEALADSPKGSPKGPRQDSPRRPRTGMVASIDLSWSLSTFDDWYVAVHGDQGSLRLGWRGSHLERADGTRQEFGSGYKKTQALGRQLAHFARLAARSEDALLARADLLASIQVVEAAYESLAAGRRVEIPGVAD
jgi:predicted dehydrogenase